MIDEARLRATVYDIDALSQQGFGHISAIARLAMISMEVAASSQDLECLAKALDAIVSIAGDIQNCINSVAEDVGCNFIDSAEHRRMAVRYEGKQR